MDGSPVAVVVGEPDFTNAVPVRLHSACLTGDVYGSRRGCCGEQFRLALAPLEDLGGGGILYLAEEGRGLGLANKMRTYQAGIEVASRIPLEAPINAHNRRYMAAKAARAGHQFDHLTASLVDQSLARARRPI
jgi:GTP cyclohydrolase II